MEIKVKKLTEDALLPVYGTEGAACFDLMCSEKGPFTLHHDNDSLVINTGLSFEIPDGYVMLVFSRSGQGFNKDVRLANCVGVIDSDYRGEVKVKLTKDVRNGTYAFDYGDAIAQAMIIPVPRVGFIEVDELSSTERGEGGFGSTDVKEKA